jgi:hypothetical protein
VEICENLLIFVASLSDIKSLYVKIINPLLKEQIVYQTEKFQTKQEQRNEYFKSIVNSIGLQIPYAKYNSNMNRNEFFRSLEVILFLIKELTSE